MMTPSIKLFSVNGTDFKISIGWMAISVLLMASLTEPEVYAQYLGLVDLLTLGQITLEPAFPQSRIAMVAFASTLIVGVYLSVILHEIGHATAAIKSGINVESIKLWAAGGVANIQNIPPEKEFFITITGPAVTFILVPSWLLISVPLFILNLTTIAWIFFLLSIFNCLMLVFNLLPLYPLDGGRILRSLLMCKTSYLKSTKYAFYTTITGISIAVVLMIAFGNYDFLFGSGIIGFLSYSSYKNFKNRYDPRTTNKFYVYEHTFTFDSKSVTDEQVQILTKYIKKQGGRVTQTTDKADFIVSRNPYKYQPGKSEAVHIDLRRLTDKIEQNGLRFPKDFKKQI